jgi:hypothetical protein
MNNAKTPLALRRAQLVAECARQRGDMADQLNLLKAPMERIDGAAGFMRDHRKSLLAGAAIALGLTIARPKPVLGMIAGGASLWRLAQRALPMVQRVLPVVRSRIGR